MKLITNYFSLLRTWKQILGVLALLKIRIHPLFLSLTSKFNQLSFKVSACRAFIPLAAQALSFQTVFYPNPCFSVFHLIQERYQSPNFHTILPGKFFIIEHPAQSLPILSRWESLCKWLEMGKLSSLTLYRTTVHAHNRLSSLRTIG